MITQLLASSPLAWFPGWITSTEPWGWHWMWGFWGVGMILGMLLFWGVVIVGIVLTIRWLVSQGKDPRPDAALEILRQRYARGEINKEEFEARKLDLR